MNKILKDFEPKATNTNNWTMENTRFKISQYACAVLLIVSSIALVSYENIKLSNHFLLSESCNWKKYPQSIMEALRRSPPLCPHRILQVTDKDRFTPRSRPFVVVPMNKSSYTATADSTFSSTASLIKAFSVRPAWRARMAIWRWMAGVRVHSICLYSSCQAQCPLLRNMPNNRLRPHGRSFVPIFQYLLFLPQK